MKNSVEITRKYQFGYMILAHIKALAVCGVFEAVAFYKFILEGGLTGKIFAGVFALIYGLVMYSYSHKLSNFDNKPYTPLEPNIKFGFLWGAAAALLNIIFVLAYMLSFGHSTVGVWVTILSIFMLAPYAGALETGTIIPLFIAAMIVIPMAATTLGYLAGNKKFDILEKIDSLTIEKDEDEE